MRAQAVLIAVSSLHGDEPADHAHSQPRQDADEIGTALLKRQR